MPQPDAPPIFLLAPTARNGSNYIFRLLDCHPDVYEGPLPEDYLVEYSHWLVDFSRTIKDRMIRAKWDVDSDIDHRILRGFGNSLVDYLVSKRRPDDNPSARLITKSISVRNIMHFRKLFPEAYLLVLVRDGRDVVDSLTRMAPFPFEECLELWIERACELLAFHDAMGARDPKYSIIRYETFYDPDRSDMHKKIEELLSFLKLDTAKYDLDKARALPVFGSSDTSKWKPGNLNYQVTKRDAGFKPVERWQKWPAEQTELFRERGGPILERLAAVCENMELARAALNQ